MILHQKYPKAKIDSAELLCNDTTDSEKQVENMDRQP